MKTVIYYLSEHASMLLFAFGKKIACTLSTKKSPSLVEGDKGGGEFYLLSICARFNAPFYRR